MAAFDFRSGLSLKGRRNEGLRGFSGKPSHPPLTDVPATAYVFVAVFDVLSIIVHSGHPEVGLQLYRAATWVLIGGAAVSLLTALTGYLDWRRLASGTDAKRTANAHAITMVTVTVIVVVDLVLRLTAYLDKDYSPIAVVILSVVAGVLTIAGAALGGSLVFEHAVRVEEREQL